MTVDDFGCGVDVHSWMKLCFMVNENGNIPVRRWEQLHWS